MRNLHGVTTTDLLLAEGLTWDKLQRRPDIERIGRGVYALPGARRDFWFDAAAAIALAGQPAALTGSSACHALGLSPERPRVIDLVVPEGKGSRHRSRGVRVRRSTHPPEETTTVGGIPVVPATYALTDLARDLPDGQVAHALSRGLGLRRLTLAALVDETDRRGSFPGSARIRRVIGDFAGQESHSRRERRLAAELRRQAPRLGLAQQLPISDAAGRIIRTADLAYPAAKVDLEVDGPHHWEPEQAEKDRRVDRLLAGIAWEVLRVTIYEVDDDVVSVARGLLATVARRLGVAAQVAS